MVTKPYPALCRECKWGVKEDNGWALRCINPTVNAQDPWALATGSSSVGSDPRTQREKRFFAACGMRGKLWEPKND